MNMCNRNQKLSGLVYWQYGYRDRTIKFKLCQNGEIHWMFDLMENNRNHRKQQLQKQSRNRSILVNTWQYEILMPHLQSRGLQLWSSIISWSKTLFFHYGWHFFCSMHLHSAGCTSVKQLPSLVAESGSLPSWEIHRKRGMDAMQRSCFLSQRCQSSGVWNVPVHHSASIPAFLKVARDEHIT